MDNTTIEAMAAQMFAAYSEQAGGTTWDDKPIPTWSEIGEPIRANWVAAARAAARFLDVGGAA